MSYRLVLKIRPMRGFTFGEKSILYILADISRDDETVFLRMDTLTWYAGCNETTARRILRRLENIGVIVRQGETTGGRGHVNYWRFNLNAKPEPDEDATQPAMPAVTPPKKEVPPQSQRQFKTPYPASPAMNGSSLTAENEEFLERLYNDLATKERQQENHVQATGRANPLTADVIVSIKDKIAKLEMKKRGETEW